MAAQEEPTQTNVDVAPRPALRAVPPPVSPVAAVPADPAVATRAPSPAAYAIAKANQILWFVCGVLELLLGMRLVLRMMGANAAAGFVRFVYNLTQPLVAPFLGMLPNATGTGSATRGAVLEVPTLIAMVVYFLLFLMVTLLLRLLISRPTEV